MAGKKYKNVKKDCAPGHGGREAPLHEDRLAYQDFYRKEIFAITVTDLYCPYISQKRDNKTKMTCPNPQNSFFVNNKKF